MRPRNTVCSVLLRLKISIHLERFFVGRGKFEIPLFTFHFRYTLLSIDCVSAVVTETKNVHISVVTG